MVKIGYKVLLAADVWAYAKRTLTSHKFPFTNPGSAVDLSNVQMALSGTPTTGRVAKIDNLDIKVSSVWEKLMTDLKVDVFTNMFIAKQGGDITPSVILSQVGDTYDNNIQAFVMKKGGTTGNFVVQLLDMGALYSKLSLIIEARVHTGLQIYFSNDGTYNNVYLLDITPANAASDMRITKIVGGSATALATLTEDISDLQRLRIKFDLDLGANFISGSVSDLRSGEWRVLHAYDTSFTSMRYLGVRVYHANKTNIFFYPMIVLYE